MAGAVVPRLVGAQAIQSAQARDRGGAAPRVSVPAGTASIAGQVVTDEERPQPVRRATVSVSAGLLSAPIQMATDQNGRFEVTDLPAGAYRILAEKPGLVTVVFGARAPGAGQGVPRVVQEGEHVTDVVLRMPRGSVIAGQVRTAGGAPAVGSLVEAQRVGAGAGTTRITAPPSSVGPDGHYRFWGLPAGDYIVRAMAPGLFGTDATQPVLPSEVRWAEALVAQAAAAPGTNAATAPPDPGGVTLTSVTFAPASPDPAGATVIRLRAGEERTGVDIDVRQVPASTVRGRVLGPDGAPVAGVAVTLASAVESPILGVLDLMSTTMGTARATTRADGVFVFAAVAPGEYIVQARQTPRGQAPLWADAPFVAAGNAAGDLTLTLRDGLTVSGRLVFDGASPPAATTATVALRPLNNRMAALGVPADLAGLSSALLGGNRPGQAKVAEDGRFTITGVVPGEYALSVTMPGMRMVMTEPGAGWVVASAMVGEVDLADRGVDVRQGVDVANVEIRVTNRPAVLSGRLLDGSGRPVTSLPLVAFAADESHWRGTRRRVVQAEADSTGRFYIAGLPAGDYLLAVVTELEPNDLANPAFLRELRSMAIPVRLSDGEQKTQDVKLAGGT
jgi:protocatechuate 3,4-dioxygenase beta subunit